MGAGLQTPFRNPMPVHFQGFQKPVKIIKRGSLPKSGPLDFATKYRFPLFFVGEEALVGLY